MLVKRTAIVVVFFCMSSIAEDECLRDSRYRKVCEFSCMGLSKFCQKFKQLSCEDLYIWLPNECINAPGSQSCPNGDVWSPNTKCRDTCGKRYRLNNTQVCVESCPLRYYPVPGLYMTCAKCNALCKKCFGPSVRECTTCEKAQFDGCCVKECPGGYVNHNTICIKPENCPGLILDERCVAECPGGFYPSHSTNPPTCRSCDKMCKTCIGPGTDQCKICSKLWYKKDCVEACPIYAPLVHINRCMATCPEEGQCRTSCKGDRKFFNGSCVEFCPSGHRFIKDNICVESCGDEFIDKNESCVEKCPWEKFTKGNECIGKCPMDMYIINRTVCVPSCPNLVYTMECVDDCPGNLPNFNKSCISECPPGYSFTNPVNHTCARACDYVVFDDQCLKQCPKDYYQEGSSCKSCDFQCDGCYGSGPGNCKACQHFNHSGTCAKNCIEPLMFRGKECTEKCPENTVFIPGHNECLDKCPDKLPLRYHQECLSNCPTDQAYMRHGHYCVAHCPDSTFRSSSTFCKDDCERNIGNGKYCNLNCCVDSCAQHLHVFAGKCVKGCPDGYNITYRRTCYQSCPNGTVLQQDNSCIRIQKCKQSGFVYNGLCVENCPTGTHNIGEQFTQGRCAPNEMRTGLLVMTGVFVPLCLLFMGYFVREHRRRYGVQAPQMKPDIVVENDEAVDDVNVDDDLIEPLLGAGGASIMDRIGCDHGKYPKDENHADHVGEGLPNNEVSTSKRLASKRSDLIAVAANNCSIQSEASLPVGACAGEERTVSVDVYQRECTNGCTGGACTSHGFESNAVFENMHGLSYSRDNSLNEQKSSGLYLTANFNETDQQPDLCDQQFERDLSCANEQTFVKCV